MKNSVAKWLLALALSVGYGGLASGLTGQDADDTENKQAKQTPAYAKEVLKHIENSLDTAKLPEQQKQQVLEAIRDSLKQAGSGQPIVLEYKFDDDAETGGVVKRHAKVQIKHWPHVVDQDDRDEDEAGDDEEETLEFKFVAPGGEALELKNMEQMRDLLENAIKTQRHMRLQRVQRDENRAAGDAMDRLDVMARLEEGRFMLGIGLQEQDNEEATEDGDAETQPGVVVDRVFDESPAAAAGLQSGDVILKVDGTEVTAPEPLQDAVQAAGKAGKALTLTYLRAGESQTVEIKPKRNFTMLRRLPQDLRERIAQIRSGADRIIVLDEDVDADIANSLADDDDALDDLRSDVESLKDDVREIKAMLKKLSERE
ncbi:S1C family serine protease [Roseimaritima ulvae]|uniref:Serine endoprotease n=1 Tax=Roseimaritima ulvae TaxID=980254 RepID=A0A5B9QQP3_9BACT|nr:PDZ domain-containing protein [Roseimaritima ulvae]QEG39815.1 serine endoprotease [Roseimaritima ulvae]